MTRRAFRDVPVVPLKGVFRPDGQDPLVVSSALVEKVRKLHLQPYKHLEPLPMIDEDEIALICWMAVDTA